MLSPRIRAALVVLAASAGLAGCTTLGPYGGIGVGVGSGYGGYGGYGYDPYYAGYGYGSGYGYNPYGWYNGYYYPGAGYWVYDPRGNRHPVERDAYWSNVLRRMIEARRAQGMTAAAKENWSAFGQHGKVPLESVARAGDSRPATADRPFARQRVIEQRAERAEANAEQRAARSERMEARRQQIQERREARPERRRPKE